MQEMNKPFTTSPFPHMHRQKEEGEEEKNKTKKKQKKKNIKGFEPAPSRFPHQWLVGWLFWV